MTQTQTVSLFGEILPRLGCINIALTGDDLEEVKAGGDTITVGREVFRVTGYQFEEEISGLTRDERSLIFRLKILDCDKLPGLIRPREELQSFCKFRFSSPSLELGTEYQLVCRCGAVVGSVRPARVLPLPSMSWKSNSLDWEVSFYCQFNVFSLNKTQYLELQCLTLAAENVTSLPSGSVVRENCQRLPQSAPGQSSVVGTSQIWVKFSKSCIIPLIMNYFRPLFVVSRI